ncbi:two-component system histidine kinase PnpS [Desmospora activa]|uniref:histidine kinase n=1 Tax=Desmospora activa DSM 45169 TaxID=1121389 RepID=A0A2T4Z881_9BACL|nr:ATP-binding protein [Desmospora activa]PTM58093.1 two-component system phosphate regulon sensor histidine kinase PhoR [Desmospora activa DSM 45169]
MKSLRNRLTLIFIVLIGLSVLGTGIFVALLLKASYLGSLTDRLAKEGQLLADTLDWQAIATEPEVFQQQAEKYSQALDAQVMLIGADGTVVGDSERPPVEWGNLSQVPEVARTLRNQTEDGYNRVTTEDRLLVYLPVEKGGRVQGVVRIALDLDIVNRSLTHVWVSLTVGLLIAYLAAAIVSSQIASRITKPLEEITQVAVDIARNKFHRRIPVRKRDEIGRLAAAINRMAAGLRYQLETIRKSERRLTSVIETMESGLLMVDSEQKVTLANQAIYRFFDVKTSQLLHKPLDRAVFHDLNVLIEQAIASGERVRDELHLYFPQERIIEVNLTPIWGEKDGMGVVAVLHDITPIRRLEKMRTEFVANVSHELKTPVTSLRGFAETLLDGAAEDPEMQREFLEIIHRESLRLERLISDLLDLSKIESRKMPIQLEPIRVKSLIQPLAQTVEEEMKKKELLFRLELEEDFTVEVDKDRFSQIVINLLANAMSYTPAGGSIVLSAGRKEDRWWLQVVDTGIGIPEEDLPRIFERFYRVDKARSRESGGTGLGLAIVKHLVESHHGEIQVDSQVGKGTTFTLTFPL